MKANTALKAIFEVLSMDAIGLQNPIFEVDSS